MALRNGAATCKLQPYKAMRDELARLEKKRKRADGKAANDEAGEQEAKREVRRKMREYIRQTCAGGRLHADELIELLQREQAQSLLPRWLAADLPKKFKLKGLTSGHRKLLLATGSNISGADLLRVLITRYGLRKFNDRQILELYVALANSEFCPLNGAWRPLLSHLRRRWKGRGAHDELLIFHLASEVSLQMLQQPRLGESMSRTIYQWLAEKEDAHKRMPHLVQACAHWQAALGDLATLLRELSSDKKMRRSVLCATARRQQFAKRVPGEGRIFDGLPALSAEKRAVWIAYLNALPPSIENSDGWIAASNAVRLLYRVPVICFRKDETLHRGAAAIPGLPGSYKIRLV
ncbi:unnamed protein product [Tilletia controversa]|uniref:Uncharacterized protein n=1 Tax=Tilletia controversa TaxID=13291 RepID=A0A8X7N1G2_9BASI|nr:hypothetical protein CF328_g288 [Tilletia controversa]KAE8255384.1 hypothetical protein A4X06_0g452 [Tilletia controversa]CAD6920393.1 unnamed protein product [Tilletia controversa]CAD6983831.1 unnamed protein product [Tilletia controversa]